MVAEAALEAAAALAGLGQLLARLGQLGGQGELGGDSIRHFGWP